MNGSETQRDPTRSLAATAPCGRLELVESLKSQRLDARRRCEDFDRLIDLLDRNPDLKTALELLDRVGRR